MAKIDITRTELVWPGKYNEDGTRKEVPRVSLPFQVIQTVNESRATREAKKGGTQTTLFDVWDGKEGNIFEDCWRNKRIWGDNHPNRKTESHRLRIGGISNTICAL
jgi:adenine-specific DNA-methyltransferase